MLSRKRSYGSPMIVALIFGLVLVGCGQSADVQSEGPSEEESGETASVDGFL